MYLKKNDTQLISNEYKLFFKEKENFLIDFIFAYNILLIMKGCFSV